MSEHIKHPAFAAQAQAFVACHLPVIDQRHKEIRRENHQRSMKTRLCYTDDRKWMFVHLNDAANHSSIILKMRVPVGMAQHHVWRTVRTMFIIAVKKTAEVWLNAHRIEIV